MRHTYFLPAHDEVHGPDAEAEEELLRRIWSVLGDDRPIYFEGVSEFEQSGRTIVRVIRRELEHATGIQVRDLSEDEIRAFRAGGQPAECPAL